MTARQHGPQDELDHAVRRLVAESLRPPPPARRLGGRPLTELVEERRRQREVLDAAAAEEERRLGASRLREVTAEVEDWEQRQRDTAPRHDAGSTT